MQTCFRVPLRTVAVFAPASSVRQPYLASPDTFALQHTDAAILVVIFLLLARSTALLHTDAKPVGHQL